MPILEERNVPVVLDYFTSRKIVGWIALGLPFALAILVGFRSQMLGSSISGYYYTGARTLFVGSLCAISILLLTARGYDRYDEIAGMFSALCALGVAFFPTAPEDYKTMNEACGACASYMRETQPGGTSNLHYTFAALLFSTLAYFCLALFKKTRLGRDMTPEKRQRNLVYSISGWTIIVSMALIFTFSHFFPHAYILWKALHPTFLFESTALIAFGIAWLVKGEAFLKDSNPTPP